MVVDGRALEEALFPSVPLARLVVDALQDDRQVLHQEHAAEDGDEQFLVDDDGKDGDDAADGQAARVAHEHLRRIGIVPQEAYQCADEGTDEDDQFLRPGDEHDVQVARELDVARDVGQDAQCQADDGRVSRRHAVHAVVQVGAVADGRHDEDGDEDEQHPARRLGVVAQEAHDVGIVQVVALEEGDGGLRGLDFLGGVYHLCLPALLHLDVLADDHLRAEVERQSHDEAQAHLADDFELAVQAFLVLLEYLDIVVRKAQRTQPDGGDEHQQHVDIVQPAQQ